METYHVCLLLFCFLQGFHATPPPVKVTPERQILLVNDRLEVKCRVGVPISYCRFAVPGVSGSLSLRPHLPAHEGIVYTGAGLERGECGMKIESVSSKHSGTIQCSMGFENEARESNGNMTLIVAKPPDPPLLVVSSASSAYGDSFMEGDTIHANCRISNARPIANISWYLGSEPIYDKLTRPEAEEENGLYSISQNLTRTVSYVDHGKDLKCVAGHIALEQGSINHSIYKLKVRFPPKPKSQELEKFGFTIGQPGKIVVTFQAYPIPDIKWEVDQDSLKQGMRDRTGRFEAGILQNKGVGTWDAVLNIKTVRAEEVEKRYTLVARNELGEARYKVAISTSPEPPANVTAGAIVGIVIAVLVILLLVFILIFARATGKWCFAGGVPRPVGESPRLPFKWSLNADKEKTPKNVNSLIYQNYTLVETENGGRSYVSPEEEALLRIESKVKSAVPVADASVSPKNVGENSKTNSFSSTSSSDCGYEVPKKPESKAHSSDDSGATVVPARKPSYPFPDVELNAEESGQINLPFYLEPLEDASLKDSKLTKSLDELDGKKKKKIKKDKKRSEKDKGERDRTWLNFGESDDEVTSPFHTAGTGSKKRIGFGLWGRSPSVPKLKEAGGINEAPVNVYFPWRRKGSGSNKKDAKGKEKSSNEKDSKTETETPVKDLMIEIEENESFPTAKNLSLSRRQRPMTDELTERSEKEARNEEKKEKENGKFQGMNKEEKSKQFFTNFPRFSWVKRKNTDKSRNVDEADAGTTKSLEKEASDDDDEKEEEEEERECSAESLSKNERPKSVLVIPEKKPSLLDLISSDMAKDLEEPEEVFLEVDKKKQFFFNYKLTFDEKDREEEGEEKARKEIERKPIYGQKLFRHSAGETAIAKKRRTRAEGPIDPNPLRKMFKLKKPKSRTEAPNEGEKEVELKGTDEPEPEEDPFESVLSRYNFRLDAVEQRDGGTWTWIYTPQADKPEPEFVYGPSDETVVAPDGSEGSDTESADHGSTDKSSMSKLTHEKQPKKLMNGLFGSFRKGKTKSRQLDAEFGKSPFSFEVSVKEQQQPQLPQGEDVHPDGPRAEGIVYAELDMTRSPGSVNVMRRDDDKTEYAEIIYPTSKMSPERAMEELRKSRENLVGSRENLAEPDDDYTTTVTPDGKKEAAV